MTKRRRNKEIYLFGSLANPVQALAYSSETQLFETRRFVRAVNYHGMVAAWGQRTNIIIRVHSFSVALLIQALSTIHVQLKETGGKKLHYFSGVVPEAMW